MRIFGVLLCCVLCVITLVAGRIYTVRRMPTGVGLEAKLQWATQINGFNFILSGGNRFTDFWNYGVDSHDQAAVRLEFARRVSLLESELQSPDDYYRWLCLALSVQQKNELTLERLDEIERRHAGHWNLASELTLISARAALKPTGSKWGRAEFEKSLLGLCQRHEKEQWDLQAWRMVFYQLFGSCQNRGELLDCYRRWREVAPQQVGWQSAVDSCLVDVGSQLFSQKTFLDYLIKEMRTSPSQSLSVVR
jgi:hypothetical protein